MGNFLNFSGGPGALPASVLRETRDAVEALPETGLSVLGMSHRSSWFRDVLDEAERNLRELLGIPDNYHLLFLQGGSSLQFAMLPMSFLRGTNRVAEYIVSGYWSAKAPVEAKSEGASKIVWDGKSDHYKHLPNLQDLALSPDAAYLHYVSNETVEGLQFTSVPGLPGVPLICDMSSDLLSAPVDVSRYAIIYAHAQKNLGPSGVTLVIVSDDFLRTASTDMPTMLDYRTHVKARSIYNTPPVFSIYVLMLVTRWLRDEIGGLTEMAAINRTKADIVYSALAADPEFYRVHAAHPFRSMMNIAFHLPNAEAETLLIETAKRQGFHGLEGHRSLGGLRASLYNAITVDAASQLADWLVDFKRCHG